MAIRFGPLVSIAVFSIGLTDAAMGQTPPAPDPADAPRMTDPYMPMYSSGHRYRSRTAPQTQSHYVDPDTQYGYRNPGGVGRMAEFYPPGNTFSSGSTGRNPVVVAQFGSGSPDLSRSAQMQAQQIGIQKTNSLNSQIDAFARPMGGFGYGFGGFGGRFPY